MSTDAASLPPAASAGGTPRPSRVPIGEYVFGALVVALGVWALVGAFTIRIPAGSRVGPTAFPIFVGALLVVAGIAVLIGVARGRLGTPEGSEDLDPNARTDWLTIAKIVGLVLAQLLLIDLIGWVPSATLLFGGVAWVLGAKRWWLAALIGLGLSFVVQIVFGELLGLSLPAGPLFGWLAPLI